MIPDYMMTTLLSHLVEAIVCARSGEWSAGYDVLLHGLHQAQISLAPTPWTGELVERYQQALEAFEQRYGVKLP